MYYRERKKYYYMSYNIMFFVIWNLYDVFIEMVFQYLLKYKFLFYFYVNENVS